MTDVGRDPRGPIDVAVNSPEREGLTGTAPASLYAPPFEREQITIAPDFAPPDAQPAWRQDFPIDWPQDSYVERRDFMKFLVLTSAAFTVGQLWIGVQNWWRKQNGAALIRRVASIDDLAVGGAVVFTYPDEHESLCAGQSSHERVRGVRPEVHPSVVRRDTSSERRQLLLSVSRGPLRSQNRRSNGGSAATAPDADRPRHSRTRHLRGRRRGEDMRVSAHRPFSREQRTTIVYGMLVFVLIVVILQLWLLTATMNAWLGGDDSVVWPAAAVSGGGLALNVGLLGYLRRMERTRRVGG